MSIFPEWYKCWNVCPSGSISPAVSASLRSSSQQVALYSTVLYSTALYTVHARDGNTGLDTVRMRKGRLLILASGVSQKR